MKTVYEKIALISLAFCILLITSSLAKYELVKIMKVEGRQGVTTDGKYIYVSSSKAIYKYSMNGKLLLSNKEPFKGWCERCNHLGDLDYSNGKLYISAEYFDGSRGHYMSIAIFDAKTLKFIRNISIDESSGQTEISGVAVDTERGLIWTSSWSNGSYIYAYNMYNGKYIGKRALYPSPRYIQGIAIFKGKMFFSSDDGDAFLWEPDHVYSARYLPAKFGWIVSLEKITTEVAMPGELEGLCFNPETGELMILHNRGLKVIDGKAKGMYPGYDEEISELYIYRTK